MTSRQSLNHARHVLLFVLICMTVDQATAKKKKKPGPDPDKLAKSAFPPTFAAVSCQTGSDLSAELANVSKAATKLQHWEEYDKVSSTLVRLLMREAVKGTRELQLSLVNPERQFSQHGELGRYSEVLDYMMKKHEATGQGGEESLVGVGEALGCVPQRERFCVDKLARAARLGSWITVENCHRWFTAESLLAGNGEGSERFDLPDVSVEWQRICSDCFSKRLQVAVWAKRHDEEECLPLSDEEAESLLPQVASNWTIDISTRTSIGGMRMEERKLLPIGPRWLPMPGLHAIILHEAVENGVHVTELHKDGTTGRAVTPDLLRGLAPDAVIDFSVAFW